MFVCDCSASRLPLLLVRDFIGFGFSFKQLIKSRIIWFDDFYDEIVNMVVQNPGTVVEIQYFASSMSLAISFEIGLLLTTEICTPHVLIFRCQYLQQGLL